MDVVEIYDLLRNSDSNRTNNEGTLGTMSGAIRAIHFPTPATMNAVEDCEMRVAFEEMTTQQSVMELLKWNATRRDRAEDDLHVERWEDALDVPEVKREVEGAKFNLTKSQEDAIRQIYDSMVPNSNKSRDSVYPYKLPLSTRMNRLLLGDVGVGKTFVAYASCLCAISSHGGGCCVVLAPTTMLAEQHYHVFSRGVEHAGDVDCKRDRRPAVVKLTGGVKGAKREDLLRRVREESELGKAGIIIVSTHAILTESVTSVLSSLTGGRGVTLSVIDEEQRFGVMQRRSLESVSVHCLYVTATPIPRSLALSCLGGKDGVVTGDKEVTVMRGKPRTMRDVKTTIVSKAKVDEVMRGVRRQVEEGAKVFWVLPLIGDSDDASAASGSDAAAVDGGGPCVVSALSRHAALTEVIGDGRVGIVHGKMSSSSRERQISWFRDPASTVDVLVGTTVLEVGVDVPSATILVVESANRFGLSQLHQLRGRVGRPTASDHDDDDHDEMLGSVKNLTCHCVLLTDPTSSSAAIERLNILRSSTDGYHISALDMSMRGPGDFIGTDQSGSGQGATIDADSHWGMLESASVRGRMFADAGVGDFVGKGSAEAPAIREVDGDNDVVGGDLSRPSTTTKTTTEGGGNSGAPRDVFGGVKQNRQMMEALRDDDVIRYHRNITASSPWGIVLRVRYSSSSSSSSFLSPPPPHPSSSTNNRNNS